VHELVVADAGAEAVDHPDRARSDRRGEQLADVGVDLVRVRPPVDRVDGRAAVQQPLAAQLEVVRRDEREPELARDPVLLPVGGVLGAVGEHDRAVAAEHAPQRGRDAVDRQRAARHVEPPQRRLARSDPVADPARRAHVVLQHQPLAGAVADQVETGDPDPDAAARAHARHRGLDVLGAVEHALRQHALRDDPALRVDVRDERVQRPHALGEARRDALPVGARDHARHGVDVPAAVAVDRLEADPAPVDLLPHGARERAQVVREHRVHHRPRGRPDAAVRRDRVVERGRPVAVERTHAPALTRLQSRADAPRCVAPWTSPPSSRPCSRPCRTSPSAAARSASSCCSTPSRR
jgi:hypothetical protein